MASRVPYHQNVYDLLGIEPGECPNAARMIAEHETKHGLLSASVREWYLVPNAVPLQCVSGPYPLPSIWGTFASGYVRPLFDILSDEESWNVLQSAPRVYVLAQYESNLFEVEFDGSDDLPVWYGYGGDVRSNYAGTFSDFLFSEVEFNFRRETWTRRGDAEELVRAWGSHPHLNRLWLRSTNEPFQPPVIDFLIDQFGEPERTLRPGNVTTYAYRPLGGTIRVTADEPTLTGGLSAWWVHADTSERLAEFARLLLPWGTLRDTLRADTEPAREVLKSVRGV